MEYSPVRDDPLHLLAAAIQQTPTLVGDTTKINSENFCVFCFTRATASPPR